MFDEKLAILIVMAGFYLLDCLVLLVPTQALGAVRRGGRGKSRTIVMLDFGWTFYPIAKRFPALLNPLLPWVTSFKTVPLSAAGEAKGAAPAVPLHRLVAARGAACAMAPLLVAHAAVMFIAIPYFLMRGPLDRLLQSIAFDFLIAAGIIGLSYPLVRMLRLGRGQYWSLAAQSLICLPLSLNFPRKLALLAPAAADAGSLMPRLPDHVRWPVAQSFIAAIEYARTTSASAASSTRVESVLSTLRAEVPLE